MCSPSGPVCATSTVKPSFARPRWSADARRASSSTMSSRTRTSLTLPGRQPRRPAGAAQRSLSARLLEVALDLVHRTLVRGVRVLAGVLARAPLAEEVPGLVELLLESLQALPAGAVQAVVTGPQLLLLLHEFVDVREDRGVVHCVTLCGPVEVVVLLVRLLPEG